MSDGSEQDLLDEIGDLTRLVAEQERAVAESAAEVRRTHATLAWRAHRRFEKLHGRLLRAHLLREPYRVLRRAVEIWIDHGFIDVFRFVGRKIGHATRGGSLVVDDHSPPDPDAYRKWATRHTPTAAALAGMRATAASLQDAPLVSVLMCVDDIDAQPVRRTMDSLLAQVYERWELLVALPATTGAALISELGDASRDQRIRWVQSAEVPGYVDAFRESRGEVVAFVSAGDVLAADALFEVVTQLIDQPICEIVYSDQDSLDRSGRRIDPFFKPTWDPELMLSTNMLGPFAVARRRLIGDVGGLRAEFGAGQLYDLMLRASERTPHIARVARVLCHLGPRDTTREAIVARHRAVRDERKAIEDALVRRGRPGCVEARFTSRGPRCYTTRFRLERRPLVSIVIPTRDQAALLRTTIDSILQRTDYDAFEIIVVDNDSREPEALAYLASLREPCQVHRWSHPFNYSAINNFGVRASRGEQLLFLNNDVEVINADWLTALLEYAQFDSVGAVGGKLLYADGTIQHAGVVLNLGGPAQHAFRDTPREVPGAPRLADLPRNCSAVTGACLMMPRRIFEELGGFDERLRVVLNDIDLCLRIRERGYAVICTPYALLYHYEGASRGRLHPPPDERRFMARWSAQVNRLDPYYSPNLSRIRGDWSLNSEG
jgi:GT2 family glycosyltransferase